MKSLKPPPEPQRAASASAATGSAPADVALIHGIKPDGSVQVLRRRGDRFEAGTLSPLREGAPIQGEVVSLRPRADCPVLCDVEVLYTPPPSLPAAPRTNATAAPASRKGPAQVATDEYRDNWDSIWSRKKTVLN
jgi:hypothetical protein